MYGNLQAALRQIAVFYTIMDLRHSEEPSVSRQNIPSYPRLSRQPRRHTKYGTLVVAATLAGFSSFVLTAAAVFLYTRLISVTLRTHEAEWSGTAAPLGRDYRVPVIMPARRPAAANDPHLPTFSGYAQLAGPLQLDMTVTPAVAHPGDSLTLNLILTNNTNTPAVPRLSITPPLRPFSGHEPAPHRHQLQPPTNPSSWQPLLPRRRPQPAYHEPPRRCRQHRPGRNEPSSLPCDGERQESLGVAYWVGVPPQATVAPAPSGLPSANLSNYWPRPLVPALLANSWDLGDGRTLNISNPIVAYSLPRHLSSHPTPCQPSLHRHRHHLGRSYPPTHRPIHAR